jgi:hypothetical protein
MMLTGRGAVALGGHAAGGSSLVHAGRTTGGPPKGEHMIHITSIT